MRSDRTAHHFVRFVQCSILCMLYNTYAHAGFPPPLLDPFFLPTVRVTSCKSQKSLPSERRGTDNGLSSVDLVLDADKVAVYYRIYF